MDEVELVDMMYKKHQKLMLSAKEAPKEWGSSYSALNKLFGGKSALPENVIIKKNIIPKWTKVGSKRMWKLTDIAKWILCTESRRIK
jgi:hypothetical protein